MIKLFSLIFSTFSPIRFYPSPTMMPSNHLLKTNYVFPHEWLVCTFCFSPKRCLYFEAPTLGEPQCTCFKLLKICCLACVRLAAREAYNTHIELLRNSKLQKSSLFFGSRFMKTDSQRDGSSFSPYESDRNAEKGHLQTPAYGRHQ